MKKFLLSLMLLASFSMVAEARPHHRKHVRHTVSQVQQSEQKSFFIWNGSDLVSKARSYMGATASTLGLRRNKWCAAFLNKLTGSGNDERAISYARRGQPANKGCVGCVAVMRHHVGVVSGYDNRGNPTIISGNHNRRVGEGTYPAGRIYAYRWVN